MALAVGVGSPYSKRIANALRVGGYKEALSLPAPKPTEYADPHSFRADYMLSTYLSKFEGFGGDADRLQRESIQSFIETESSVRKVNTFLRLGSAFGGVEGVLSDARRKISRLLDRVNPDDCEFPFGEFIEGCGWGPGATATLNSSQSQLDKKILETQLSVTRRAAPYANAYFQYDSSWCGARFGYPVEQCMLLPSEFQIIEYDRFTTVPKNWKTRRSIAIQPTLNIFLQKGVGRMLRNRLRRDGINLDDQSRNQSLAQRCYAEGYCTIDLAKASDTVSLELVNLLFPPSWLKVMDDLRTRYTKIGDHMHKLEKFSAMGNGFTFELESMIFYALLWSVVRCEAGDMRSEIGVYGDDLIVSRQHYDRVVEVLSYCGFTVNAEKSFKDGPFFESCGKHFFHGVDVTPIYQKNRVSTLPEAIRCANRIFRWALHSGHLDSRVRTAWEISCSFANSFLVNRFARLCRVPQMPWYLEGDDALLYPSFSGKTNAHGQMSITTLSFSPTKVEASGYALLSYTLRCGVERDSPFNGLLSLRGYGKYRVRQRLVTRRLYGDLAWF